MAERPAPMQEVSTEELFDLLVDEVRDCAIFVLDPKGHVQTWNRGAERLLGFTAAEIVGRPATVFFTPEDIDAGVPQREIQQSIEQSQAHEGRWQVRKDQSRFWADCKLTPLRAGDGGIRGFARIVRERTERTLGTETDLNRHMNTEPALEESEAKFRLLADTIPQLAWMARADGHIFWFNRRWYEYTGTTPEQMEGWGWESVHDPGALPDVLERWQRSIVSGEPFDMVFPLKGADDCFRPFLTRVNPWRTGTGDVLYWFGTNTDVSESKRAEDAARFLSNAGDALAAISDPKSTLEKVAGLAVPYFADWCTIDLVDSDGSLNRLATVHSDPARVELANDLRRRYPPRNEDSFGPPQVLRTLRPEAAFDITDDDLAASARDQEHLALLQQLDLRSYISVPIIARGKAIGVLSFITSESGRRYGPADLSLAEDLAHRAAIAIDNAILYHELRDADRRKDEFLATLAHELRNPLAPIRNSLQILQLPHIDAATIERSHAIMERQVDQLVRLVDDLLDVSRVMRGKIELRRERVELATVVARAVEMVQPLIDAQSHEFTITLSSESLPLYADPVRLAQALSNLLANASKYTEPKGRISLAAVRTRDEAVLTLRDDGIGIAPEMLPRIFELFVQVDHAATRSQGGLGIGLTLVKNLVEMHGGRVEASSPGLGRGAEFVVSLPLSTSPTQEDAARAAGKGIVSASAGHPILVIDDNQDAAVSLAMLLRFQGHEVRVAHSGVAALELIKDYVPAAVFLDIGMPGMDGYDVARRLRRQPGLEHVVLAALTGWGQLEDRRRTAEAGFDFHLVKPPDERMVREVLEQLSPCR